MAAGPQAQVPTCPNWTVHKLVRHIARVQSWVVAATEHPEVSGVRAGEAPREWERLLDWWEQQREALRAVFDRGPGAPTRLPFSSYPPVVASWARRQAHEAAIHRVDAELTLGAVTVTFDPEFAADGIDELLMLLVHRRTGWSEFTADGTVLVHAEDAGRLWSVRLAPGSAPQLAEQPFEPDVTIEGSADAVYRAVWRRPSEAKVTGDVALLEPLAAP
ncbi:maleylpyruvate isomerase family mycothiol-dependent enzyme [Saccharomonospora amisosensis]|uniref:maleylpyruvate isomerase family mycothiol-dependent enzyme n=1 Tax=Saccharomonospora amisosensis TaxID=1128677 RepID=UPI0028BDDA62|nr:maleylpyruvate isomerase family mycothiol-dependent enzyme [Saccharomonospora amisosensis]